MAEYDNNTPAPDGTTPADIGFRSAPQPTEPPPPYPGGPANYPPPADQTKASYPSQPMYPPTGAQGAYVAPVQPGVQGTYVAPMQPGVQGAYVVQPGYPSYSAPGQTVVITSQQPRSTVLVSGSGTCPFCKQGYMVEQFTFCGIMMAILFFPIGLICCLMMKQRMCSHCRAVM